MGNSESQDKYNSQIVGVNNILTHPRFSNAKIVNETFGLSHILLTVSVPNKKLYTKWKQRINNITLNSKDNLPLMLPIQMEYNQDSYCGSSGIMKVKYQKFPFILSQQIENRSQAGRRFKQNEVWYITYVFILTAGQLHKSNRVLGDVRPFNTFINDNGELLVGNICTFYDEQLNYEKTRLFKETTYLAPQVLEELSNGYDPKSNQLQAEDFAVGLCLLDVALLQSSEELYSKTYEFDKARLKKKLQALQTYIKNDKLKSIIKGLCSTNPKYRMKTEDILETLSPYEQKILSLEAFQIQDNQDKLVPVGLSKRSSIVRQSTLRESSKIKPDDSFVEKKSSRQLSQDYKRDKSPSPIKYAKQQEYLNTEHIRPVVFSPRQKQTIITRNLPPLPPNIAQQQISHKYVQPVPQNQIYQQDYYPPRIISQKIIQTPNYRQSRSLSRELKAPIPYQTTVFLGESPSQRVLVHSPQISRTNSFQRINYAGNNMYVPGQINTCKTQFPVVPTQNSNFNRTAQNYQHNGDYQQFLRRSKNALKQNSTDQSSWTHTEQSFKEASSIYIPQEKSHIVTQPNKYETPKFNFEPSGTVSITTSRVQYTDTHNPEPIHVYAMPQYKYSNTLNYSNANQGNQQYNENLRRIQNQVRQTRMRFPQR